MSATRILWGQLLLVSVIAFGFVWGATEWTAWRLDFQDELGAPWFMLGHWPVYAPAKLFFWWYWFDVYAPHVFEQGGAIAVSGTIMAIVAALGLSVRRAREASEVTTYGSARWATAPRCTAPA